jgi:hypothetical protein
MKRLLCGLIALLIASPLYAQQNNQQTQLRLVIIDQLDAGIPAATVTVKREGAEPITFTSDERGLAISPPLDPGAVTIQVEFPGFEPFEAPLTLRRGAMNERVTLRIEGFKEEVQVTDADAPEASRAASTTTLSQEEIESLPDDPEELEEALLALAGPGGATFMMNGFSGGRLPNRDQIRSIRFRQNNYAADNHDAGRAQIEIVTRPNTNWGGSVNSTFGGDALNARHPQQAIEQPSQERQVQFNVRGPVVRGRTSFNFNANGNTNYRSQPLTAIDEFGNRVGDTARSTTNQNGFTLGMEHSLTANQGIYLNFQRSENEGLNQGVGGWNVPERARTTGSNSNQLRFRLQGLVGPSSINEFRLQVNRSGNDTTSLSRASAIIVQDAFSRGGAGQFSNSSTNRVEMAENFDFNWGRNHAMRVGVLLDYAEYNFFSESNQAGTWTYRNIDDFRAGLPQQFSQQIGAIDTKVTQYQLGFFWSDEFRVHRDFALGVGVRNEMQSRIEDKWNLMPRLGFTWAPFGSQQSAVRGGYGLFYDWYEANLYDQTLRRNGTSIRDIRITCSELNGYCSGIDVNDPLSPGLRSTASGRVQAHPDLEMPRVHQASISYDRQLRANMTLQTSYQMLRGRYQFRGRNLNVPVAGVRPNPAFGDITQFESTGRSQSDRLNVGVQFRIPTRQMMVRAQYTLGQEKNHGGGATSLPSDNENPDVDWGPAGQDIRHRLQLNGQLPQFYGVRINLNGTIQSGGAYNWTTGRDDNDDGVFNDRPIIDGVRVTRNSLRGDPTWSLNMNLNKRFNLGGLRPGAQPGRAQQTGVAFQRGGGGGQGGQGGFQGNRGNQQGNNNSRFGLELQVQAQNILNHVTKTGYTGNMSSPFFRTATGVNGGRDINIRLGFQF